MVEVAQFAEFEDEFIKRVHRAVWCNMATVDSRRRPRSRIMHTIWEGSAGWTATRRGSFKNRHLEANPFVSLAYIADTTRPVYVDCRAEWADDLAAKAHVWQLFTAAPPPLGYDPKPVFTAPDNPNFGVLRLTPWRIGVVTESPYSALVWHAP